MTQPTVRFAATRDSSSIQGVSFVPKIKTFKVTVTGADNLDFWLAPAGTFVSRVVAWIEDALNGSGTVEIGTSANADALIDTADWNEANANAVATNVGSSNADNPAGLFLPTATQMRITIGGSPTEGTVCGFIEYFELADMCADDNIHYDLTAV
jgi:hypothetical protein